MYKLFKHPNMRAEEKSKTCFAITRSGAHKNCVETNSETPISYKIEVR